MGTAAALLIARNDDADPIVVDVDLDRARAVVARAGCGEARVPDEGLARAIEGADAVAACLPYRFNLDAMEAALGARVPYADLGGLYHMTLRQLELDARFRDAGVPVVIGIGACPGISNLFAALAARRLGQVESVDIYDGARTPGVEGFEVPYSVDTILDEFTLPGVVFEGGVMREVPAGSGAVRHRFVEPVGEMEAFYTLHSELATLPSTIEGVRDVRWRLALPDPIVAGFRALVALGFAEGEPREMLRALASKMSRDDEPPRDVEALEVVAVGADGQRFHARALFRPQPEGIGAGAFGTAAPIAVCARWLAEGRVDPGVRAPETALEPEEFLDELAREGVEFTID
jgi:saccharopine dehydrogenase (NAD+, L-lysine-forming)